MLHLWPKPHFSYRWIASHDNSAGVGNALLYVFVRQDHGFIDKNLVFNMHIFSHHRDSFDANPVPNHILPPNDRVTDESVVLNLSLAKDHAVWNACSAADLALFADDNIRPNHCILVDKSTWMDQNVSNNIFSACKCLVSEVFVFCEEFIGGIGWHLG